jgi:SAM-dependent methyltransferase
MKSLLKRSPLFAFNLVFRDRWVAAQAATLPAGARVLDIGAGSCPYRSLFAHCDYRTQDFSGLQDDQLRHGGYGRIDYVCDAADIPAPEASFDALLCTEVLEHLVDPVRVVKEFARLLRPGGRLMLTAPLGSGIHQEPHHYFGGFTPWWYRKFLTEAGFDDIRIEANAGSFRFFSQEAIRFQRSTMPFRCLPVLPSLFWAPLWALLLPVLCGLIPLAAAALDRYDREQRFTVGYHVTARRRVA